jgi:hypothetical protein
LRGDAGIQRAPRRAAISGLKTPRPCIPDQRTLLLPGIDYAVGHFCPIAPDRFSFVQFTPLLSDRKTPVAHRRRGADTVDSVVDAVSPRDSATKIRLFEPDLPGSSTTLLMFPGLKMAARVGVHLNCGHSPPASLANQQPRAIIGIPRDSVLTRSDHPSSAMAPMVSNSSWSDVGVHFTPASVECHTLHFGNHRRAPGHTHSPTAIGLSLQTGAGPMGNQFAPLMTTAKTEWPG